MTSLPPPIPAGAPQPPGGLPVGPVPTQITVGQALGPDGRPIVVLQVGTPVGLACYFLDADCAGLVGAHLTRVADVTRAGLVVPGNGVVPTNGEGPQ